MKLHGRVKTVDDLLDFDILEEALQVRATHYLKDVYTVVASTNAPDKTRDNEMVAQQKLPMVYAHFDCITAHIYRERLSNDTKNGAIKNANNRALLNLLGKIYMLDSLSKDNGILFSCGYMAPDSFRYIIQALDICIKEVRP